MNLQVYLYICREESFPFFNTAKFFIVLKIQKLPKCSQTDKWAKKVWHIPKTGHHPTLSGGCASSLTVVRMNFDNTVLYKRRKTQEVMYSRVPRCKLS